MPLMAAIIVGVIVIGDDGVVRQEVILTVSFGGIF